MHPGRVICGIGTVYGVPSPNDGRSWSAAQFQQFLELETAVALRVDHGVLVNSSGVIASVGMVRRFASITYPVPGLLILAEIHKAEGFGDQLLSDLTLMTQQSWLPQTWGLSVGALLAEDGAVWPYEFSICRRPAFSDCKILGVGVEAMNVWDLLTERQVAA
jgi:hypothetical protein